MAENDIFELSASMVEPHENSDVLMVSFAQESDDEPQYFVMQRLMGKTDEETKKQAVYFEINDQSNSTYGSVESAQLTRASLELHLPEKVAAAITASHVSISFELEDADFGKLRQTLQRLLVGENYADNS